MSYRATIIMVILVLSLLGLFRYARGPEHHHGDDVGTHGVKIVVVKP